MDVAEWLRGLGLEHFAPTFRDNDIDWEVLRRLNAEDLRDLGVTSIGHRRRLLDGIAALGEGRLANVLPSVAHALDAADNADAERRQLTLMFCDLVGSTALAAQLDPEELREVIGGYHTAVADEIRRFDGYVAKYMGDGVLAYFGYPHAHEDDSERAVRAGLGVVARVGGLARPLQVRVGIATGLVVVGDLIGTGEAQERGVVGETPNLAARLQGLAPANGVLVAEATRRLAGGLFEYRDLGSVELRGFERPARVWQVLGASAVASRFEALHTAVLSPLVGRGEDIELILRRWQRAKAGEGQVLLLSGEPGIGKSRLTSVLQENLRGEMHTQLRYFCSRHHRDSALYPFLLQLENAADLRREDPGETKLEKLELLLAQNGEDPNTIALIADLLGLASSDRYPPVSPDPQRRRELTLAALIRQLEALARRRPVLVIFEDAQWADPTSIELLDRVVERVARLPVLLVITYRPEFAAPWVGQAHVSALSLSRLTRREIAAMVMGITAGKSLPPEILDCIVERTDGIPLFVEELTKSMLESGLLREQVGAYVLDGPLPLLAIPSSLQGSLLARLDRLSQVKEVVQIGAAIGRKFSYELLAAVARCSETELCAALGQLTAAGLVFRRGTPPQASYVFKHALVQDVAYSTLLRNQRQKLHARIAEALEERLVSHSEQDKSAGEHDALLADHWLKAENDEKALHFTSEAAKRAEKFYARTEAISQNWKALKLLERLPPTPERNRLHVEIISSLAKLPGSERDEAAKAQMLSHVDRALKHATEAGELATIARLEVIKGVQEKDELLLSSAIAHAEASGDAGIQAATANAYGMYLGGCARYATSLDHISRAIEIAGNRGQRLEQAYMMISGGRCFSARAGKLAESIAYAARAREMAEELGDARLRAWCAMEAEPFMYMGLWDKVIEVAEKWLPLAWEIREWPSVFWSSAWLAIAYLKLKQPTYAKQILDRLFTEMPARGLGVGAAYAVPYGHIANAQLHLQTDQFDLALGAARQAISSSQQTRAPLEEGAAHRVLGQVYEAMNAHAEADAAFDRSLKLLEQIQCPPELAQTLLAYGRFRRGDNAQKDRMLIERALRLFEQMGATGWIEEARAL